MADNSNRGFAGMDPDKQKQIARSGGQASGGKFTPGSQRASDAGKRGAAAQSTEAKARGGRNSHRS
jgi:general stress protein YciG